MVHLYQTTIIAVLYYTFRNFYTCIIFSYSNSNAPSIIIILNGRNDALLSKISQETRHLIPRYMYYLRLKYEISTVFIRNRFNLTPLTLLLDIELHKVTKSHRLFNNLLENMKYASQFLPSSQKLLIIKTICSVTAGRYLILLQTAYLQATHKTLFTFPCT
jgi:hypothetical protein